MTRRDNRESLTRLFQGYVNDYGPVDGQAIIKAIVDCLGGLRITVPDSSARIGVRYRSDSMRYIGELWKCLIVQFGESSGKTIMKTFLCELGGLRLCFPDHETLYREERNRRIRELWNEQNAVELGAMFGLDPSMIRLIVAKGEDE